MSDILLIDNFDSFLYNLVDQLKVLSYRVFIFRNNFSSTFLLEKIKLMHNPILIISAGPGVPKKAGCILELIKKLKGIIPILGICLGHQAIIEAYGGVIKPANEILHGQSSLIHHNGKAMFQGLKNPLSVARYHSLVGTKIPKTLIVNAQYNNMVMGIINEKDRVCGFQFHPESILTTQGEELLKKTLKWIVF
ncbi:aminodeoxychorismate/anthranilate synthase component II [Candidatus Tachikawaea gelatinosa]|uniref:Aminodeoxychorismate synthase component 2 n=1 Tax=Candidatus Tachikawaea gelatinosa TaxID=1410383 RepID=A0A090AQY8_9ENTR|nr:aminodeoxychorismate/anthranilate synthase component II [Candidatus Tachikawaea gelatinosa]BAP58767.1 anthranilate phosphoribosyltransferase [Candidatus Tachikawaea gelatinosa]